MVTLLSGRMPDQSDPDEVLASWQHVEQRALDLRAAGVPGTLQELRVRAYLDRYFYGTKSWSEYLDLLGLEELLDARRRGTGIHDD